MNLNTSLVNLYDFAYRWQSMNQSLIQKFCDGHCSTTKHTITLKILQTTYNSILPCWPNSHHLSKISLLATSSQKLWLTMWKLRWGSYRISYTICMTNTWMYGFKHRLLKSYTFTQKSMFDDPNLDHEDMWKFSFDHWSHDKTWWFFSKLLDYNYKEITIIHDSIIICSLQQDTIKDKSSTSLHGVARIGCGWIRWWDIKKTIKCWEKIHKFHDV